MAEQSSMHFYLNWAKERIDEMDAALASLEAKAGQVQAPVSLSHSVVAETARQAHRAIGLRWRDLLRV